MVANHKPTAKQGGRSAGQSTAGKTASKGIAVVKRGGSYVVGGTDAKELVSGHSTRSFQIQSSPKKGKLSVQEVSSLVKRMKVAA